MLLFANLGIHPAVILCTVAAVPMMSELLLSIIR